MGTPMTRWLVLIVKAEAGTVGLVVVMVIGRNEIAQHATAGGLLMNLESLRKHCATEVMGWQVNPAEMHYLESFSITCSIAKWQPDTNIEQAMMLFDNFRDKDIDITFDGDSTGTKLWEVTIWLDQRIDVRCESAFLSYAITLACAKATGWKDE